MNDDRITELYDGAIGSEFLQKRARRRIHWLCAQAAGDRVLDAGCSQGIAALLLGREGRTVVGVDRERQAIEFAQARLENEEPEVRERVSFVVGELAGLPFEADSFDGVMLGEVLEHQLDPRPTLMEVARVLRPGGVLALTTPYGHFPYHDHKEPIYLAGLLDKLAEGFAIQQLSLIDAYLAIVAHPRTKGERGLGRIDWRSALDVAEQRLRSQEEALETSKAAAAKARSDAATRRDEEAKLRTELRKAAAGAEAATAELERARGRIAELERIAEAARGDAEAATSRLAARDQRVEELSEQSAAHEQQARERGEALREAVLEVVAARESIDALRSERSALRSSLRDEREAAATARAERDDARRRHVEPVAARAESPAEADRGEPAAYALVARNGDVAVQAPLREPVPAAVETHAGSPEERDAGVAVEPPPAIPAAEPDASTAGNGHQAATAVLLDEAVAPTDYEGWLKLAREVGPEEPEQAAHAALRAADLAPDPAEALWLAADRLAQTEDRDAFGSVMERLGPLERLEDKDLRRYMNVTIAAGDYQRTLTVGPELERRRLTTPTISIAVALWESGDEAAAMAAAAPFWAPGASDAHLLAGVRFLVRTNQFDEAEALLDLFRKPDVRPCLAVGRLLRRNGQLARSLEAFEKALAADPDAANVKADRRMVLSDLAVVEDRWAPPAVPQRLHRVPRRVLHVLERTAPHHLAGSTVRSHSIGRAQVGIGLDVHMVTHPGFPWSVGVDDAALCDVLDDVHYHRLRDPENPGRMALDQRLCRHLLLASELVEELRPAVLHAHSRYVNALVALELGRRFGIPVVYEVRGFPEERRFSPRNSRAVIDTGATPRRLEQACWQRADHVTTLAEVMKRHIVASGVPPEKVTVVTNAIDPEELTPTGHDPALAAELGLPDGVPVVGYISTFAPYDGIQYLIRAVARLRDRGRRVHCLLVGDGTERDALESEVDALELRDRVTLTGFVDHDDIARYYGLLDVFVVPRTNEKVSNLVTPLKPYEAMATERAVVLAKTTALAEMGAEGETVRFFTAEDPESLADVLEDLIERPEEREALARRGRAWVTEHRTWARNVELYEDVYRRLGAL